MNSSVDRVYEVYYTVLQILVQLKQGWNRYSFTHYRVVLPSPVYRLESKGFRMIIIDYKDTRPIYEQIVEKFKTMILKGILKPDEQMPSVRNLAMELSINPNTIQKAYAELERQGYIYVVKGRGNFVAESDRLLDNRMSDLKEAVKEKAIEALEYGVSLEELIVLLRELDT